MINYYKIIIKGKYCKNVFQQILGLHINIYDIKYQKNAIVFKISYNDYAKIKEIKTSCQIEIIGTGGTKKIIMLFQKYKLFIIFFLISLLIIFAFSHMIFYININTTNSEIINIMNTEMKQNNLQLYSFKKKYSRLQEISKKIQQKYSNNFEWLEISNRGVKYEVNLIERKRNLTNNPTTKNNIIASKNGLIMDIYAENGEIIKNKGDYVSKGDIIVSGLITKNDEIKNIVNAKAKVYAETWYKVKISYPFIYKEKKITNKGVYKLTIKIFDKEFSILKFNINNLSKEKEKYIIKNNLFSIKNSKKFKVDYTTKKYNKDELIKLIEKLATDKIKKDLTSDEKIILQKTLKIVTDNDKMYIEVFFKVYENIASLQSIIN